MDKDNNILQFPKMDYKATGPQSPEELAEMLADYKKDYADEIAEMLWNHVLGELTRAGCNFDKDIERYFPSMVLILEAIRSLHLQSQGLEHPLQKFAATSLDMSDLKITNKMVDIDEEMD